ncbi:2-amino-4-hydroxy-6-hydroxymethyldihydropteridine diphosphokinase [Microbacteriaceae bacterium VKM Ac-2855]|nr:2-amino-4-hydroxy-6-hydroxymethyldihydropteridine diphosphokinase [Microbacteriaceae bacterium VKM Ac-2855]
MQRIRPERKAVLALGSNLGDRLGHLQDAVDALAALPGFTVQAVSKVVESPAWKVDGVDESAPAYFNAVVLGGTTLDPLELLRGTAAIEQAGGRVRGAGEERWGDRSIDIDLITVGGVSHDDETLVLPHPRAWQRAFVLEPWLDIEPFATLPGSGAVAELRRHATDAVADRPETLRLPGGNA